MPNTVIIARLCDLSIVWKIFCYTLYKNLYWATYLDISSSSSFRVCPSSGRLLDTFIANEWFKFYPKLVFVFVTYIHISKTCAKHLEFPKRRDDLSMYVFLASAQQLAVVFIALDKM